MAQHDYVIANGTGAAVRSDLNNGLAAIVSNNSGATEPGTMYAYQWWADTTTGLLKQRNAANNAWITIGTLASANLGLLPLAGGTMTGALAVTAGTAALPGIAVSGDLNTGITSPGADQLAISTGGTSRLAVSTTAVSSTLAVDVPLGAAATPSITFTGDLNTGVFSPGADTIALVTGGTNRVHVTSGGLVGIGASDPQRPLDVVSDASAETVTFRGASANNISTLRFNSYNASTSYASIQSRPAYFEIATAASVPLLLVPGAGTGVGIGTTGPQHSLSLLQGNALGWVSGAGNAKQKIEATGTDGFDFYTGSTPTLKATLDSSGRLLVGTSTSDAQRTASMQIASAGGLSGWGSSASLSEFGTSYNPWIVLQRSRNGTVGSHTVVSNGDTLGGIQFTGSDGDSFEPAAWIKAEVDGTPGNGDMPGRLVFSTTADGASSPTERMRITNDGSLFLYTLSGSVSAMAGIKYDTSTKEVYYDTSSRLAKENIADLKHGLDAVKAIQPRTYTAIGGDPNQEIIGFIADELVSVVPEAVFSGAKSAITGNDEDTEIVPLGISYDSLIPVLVKALQEAMERIETLEADVAQLKGA